MQGYLRIRDFVNLGSLAAYPNIEDSTGRRDMVKASATRNVKQGDKEVTECISFVRDTHHNRCMLLLNREIEEVSEWQEGKGWARVSKAWAEGVFSPCAGEKPVAAPKAAEGSGEGGEPEINVSDLESILKLRKGEQVKVVTTEGCPMALLKAISETEDPRVSPKAKSLALSALKDLAEDDAPAGDGSDDAGEAEGGE